MRAMTRLAQLERLADLRVTASERRVAASARAEADAVAVHRSCESRLEAYHARMPSLRKKVYRDYGSGGLTRGGIDILHEALAEVDRVVELHVADIEAAAKNIETARTAHAECTRRHRKIVNAQRRRAKLGERIRDIALRDAGRREELELDEWRRVTSA